jgi:type IV pilus assembly protein PilE
MPKRCQAGFTLIEMMITMAVIAILTAIAIPSYTVYIQRSNRSEARGQMLEGATWMERWRTERGRYDDPASAGNPPPTFPAALQQSPSTGGAKYNIAVAATAVTYTITATPTGSMAGDVCGNLVINQTGQRLFTGGGGTQDLCWNR